MRSKIEPMKKRCLHLKTRQAYKVLQVRILLDLRHRLFIGQRQLVFDDYRANGQTCILTRTTLGGAQTLPIALGQIVPGYAMTHQYPAVVFIKSGLKRPVELGQRKLLMAV